MSLSSCCILFSKLILPVKIPRNCLFIEILPPLWSLLMVGPCGTYPFMISWHLLPDPHFPCNSLVQVIFGTVFVCKLLAGGTMSTQCLAMCLVSWALNKIFEWVKEYCKCPSEAMKYIVSCLSHTENCKLKIKNSLVLWIWNPLDNFNSHVDLSELREERPLTDGLISP